MLDSLVASWPPAFWLAAAVAVLLTGISKSGLAGAFGGMAVPLMALWVPPGFAVAVMAPVLCMIDLFGINIYRGQWSKDDVLRLIPGALIGIAAGTLTFGLLDDRVIRAALGTIALLFVAQRLLKLIPERQPGRLAGWLCGTLGGLTSTVAHAGGPPVLMYLLARRLPKQTFIATMVVFFTVINLVKLVPYTALGMFTLETLAMSAILAPLVPVGVWAGLRLQRLLPERVFFVVATALLGVTGLQLLYESL